MPGNKTPETRKEREKKQRQEDIFSAARTLFAQNGFESTTMEDISRKAEFAKGTLYNFFSSKEDLFVSMVTSEFDKLISAIEITVESDLPPAEILKELIKTQLQFFQQNKDFFKLIIIESEKMGSNIKFEKMRIIQHKHIEYYSIIAEYFRKYVSSSIYRDIAPNILAHTLVGMIKAISLCFLIECTQGSMTGTPSNLIDSADMIYSLFMNGAAKAPTP